MVSAKQEGDYFRHLRLKAGLETCSYISAKVHDVTSWKTVIFSHCCKSLKSHTAALLRRSTA